MKQKRHSFLARATMTLLLVLFTSVGAWANSVSYIDENGQQQSHDCTQLTKDMSTLSSGWYYVEGTVSTKTRYIIDGDVKLILVDGCTLEALSGIGVSSGQTLTIYAQSGNSGTIKNSSSSINQHDWSIGQTGANNSSGTINIHGGRYDLKGYYGTYRNTQTGHTDERVGGGCIGGSGGIVTITRGTISAKAGCELAAIGGSEVTISGGNITAIGGKSRDLGSTANDACGAGIGGSKTGSNFGIITITGGIVNASAGGALAYGIGSGSSSSSGSIIISGGQVTADRIGGKDVSIELGWSQINDFIYNKGVYNSTVTLKKQFNTDNTLLNPGTVSDLTTINGKKLVAYALEGTGSKSDPYIISTTENWTTFCQMLSSCEKGIFTGKYVKLTNDITITTMAGSSQHDFTGIFDGGGNTLTFNYGTSGTPTSEQYVAPFRYVTNTNDTPATIKNLHVKGDIYTSAKNAAGIVAQHWGTLNIENCRSSIVIHSSITGDDLDGTHGGFEAVNNGILKIQGCVFDGKLLTTESNTNCGGFVGWCVKGSTTEINNSLFAPAKLGSGETEITSSSCTFARNWSGTPTNSYYTRTLGTAQGLQTYSISGGTGVTVEPAGSPTVYSVSGITAYNKGIKYNNVFYAGDKDQVSLTLSGGDSSGRAVTYNPSAGSLAGSDNSYTLTMPAANVTITIVYHASPLLGYSSTYDPDGSEQKPYIINSTAGWDYFCDAIENSSLWNHFSGKTVRLEAPIIVSKMAGSSSHPFAGTFDGYNQTLTFTNKTASEAFCAPFRYVNGATIKRLTVAGEVINTGKQTGGLIAYAQGNNTIDHCIVTASLTSSYSGDASNGGFIAHMENGTTSISDCVFNGSLLGASATNSAGFVGWVSNTKVKITNCIFAPADLTMGTSNSYTFNRNGKNELNNCYYTMTFGRAQGTGKVNTSVPEVFSKIISGVDGIKYYAEGTTAFTGVNSTYEYTGSVIAITPTVTFGGAAVSSDDYTFSTTPATVKEPGEYTLTITGKNNYVGTKSMTFKVLSVLTTDASGAYIIKSANDWDLFCDYVNNRGETFSEKTIKLAASIEVSEMVGTYNKKFSGTFDGGGMTLTFNKTVSESGTAPFKYVDGATFKNLSVTGTIDCGSSNDYAAGIVAFNNGNTKIVDCTSNITISATGYSQYHAGFVGQNGSNGTLSFERCTFSGSMTGNQEYPHSAGFVGYNSNTNSDVTISYTDCLFDPSSMEVSNNYCATFNLNGHNAFTRTYYTKSWGEAQGAAAYTTVPDAGVFKQVAVNGKNFFTEVEMTTDLSDTYNYKGSTIVLTPIVTIDGQAVASDTYTVVVKDANNNDVTTGIDATGSYTLTITCDGTQFTGSKTFSFTVISYLAGEGTADAPYLINNAKDWAAFATNIGLGKNLSAHYQLTGSFETDIMIGDNSNKFSGHLDGNNQTLTFNKEASEAYCAPFRYVNGATIEKLTVAGNVSNSGKQIGGLIAHAQGDNIIDQCIVTASLTSSYSGDASNGGFIAHINNGTTSISDCVFKGSLLGSSATHSSGFVGYISDTKVNFTNCFFAPAEVTMGTNNSCTFNRNGRNSITDCYYTTTFGTAQGNMASATIPENRLYKPVTAVDGVTYYAPLDVTNVFSVYAYNDGNAIAIEPVVKLGNDVVSADNFTVTIKDNDQHEVLPKDLKEKGSYTLTISGNNATYGGSQDLAFNIVAGASLDGYVFTTEGEDENIVYLINNEADLERLAAYVNSGHKASGMTFKLNDDITMKAEHTAIGKNYSNRFYGTFNGDNKTIKDLTINKENEDYQGLFGAIGEAAVIKDVTLQDCNITGKEDVGGIVGLASGDSKARATIQNCHVKNGKIFGTVSGADSHGGIAGYTYGTNVTDCTVSGEVTSTAGNQRYGGIVGKAYYYITVTNCENSASISSTNQYIGGIVGYVNGEDNRYENCLNTGSVSGGSNVGSIAGSAFSSTSYNKCYYTNELKAVKGSDRNGTARVFTITGDEHIASIATAEDVTVVSTAGTKYYTAGDWTLTVTLQDGLNFISMSCEGGTLSNPASLTNNKLTISNADVKLSTIVSQSSAVDMADVAITDIPNQRWIGNKAYEPALNVSYQGTPLTQGTDYMIEFSDNTTVGTATVTLTGFNAYKGTVTKTFNIVDFQLRTPGKDNSADNPYLVESEEDLEILASIVNSGSRTGGYYQQTDNIELTKEHTAIGTQNKPFTGSYNGKNGDTQYSISGLTINKPDDNKQGLFGCINNDNSIIENVAVIGCNIKGKEDVGGIVGYLYNGKVKNCFVTGHLEGTYDVGAIMGDDAWGSLEKNYYTACNVKGIGSGSGIGYDSSNQTTFVAKITAGDNVVLTLPNEPAYSLNDQKYYKPGTSVTLDYNLPENNYFIGYSVNSGTISNAATMDGSHKLDGFTQDVVITGIHVDEPVDIVDANIADITRQIFSRCTLHPNPVVTYNNITLTKDVDYELSWSDGCYNVGEYTITVTGKGNFKGTKTKTFTIEPYNITYCNVTISNTSYTGKEITVVPTVKDYYTLLYEGESADYTFTTNPAVVKDLGDYTMTITGHGNYTGTKEVSFKVIYAVPNDLTCTALTTTSATLEWTEAGIANQWTVEYSTDKTFATSEAVTVNATTLLLENLTEETTYYARVKAVYGENEVSDWSSVLSFEPTAKLIIGSGTATLNCLPIDNAYLFGLSEQIYTAEEMGGKAGIINSLDFYKDHNISCNRNIDIYLVNTTKSRFDNNRDIISITESDKVFSGTVKFDDYKWTSIKLDKSFQYDGTSNLAIIIDDNTGSCNNYTFFRTFKAKDYQSIIVRSNNTNYTPTSSYNFSVYTDKSQVRIGIDHGIVLANNASDNSTIISENDDEVKNVTLTGRTLYKDGDWNTLCLPFNVTLAGSPLEGATAMKLDGDKSSFDNGVLTLNFEDEKEELVAGTPYLIKWDGDGSDNLVNPTFTNVTIDNSNNDVTSADGTVTFTGTYDYQTFDSEDKSVLFLGGKNTLYYPQPGMDPVKKTAVYPGIGACRAYFKLSDPTLKVKAFNMSFSGDIDRVVEISTSGNDDMSNDAWYTLDGRQLSVKPAKKGLYIHNGQTVKIQ